MLASSMMMSQRKWLFTTPFSVPRKAGFSLANKPVLSVQLPQPVFEKEHFDRLTAVDPIKAAEYESNYNLLVLQKRFYDNPTNAQSHYYYFKELNRQKKHAKVVELYEQYTYQIMQTWYQSQDADIVYKIIQQARYAEIQRGFTGLKGYSYDTSKRQGWAGYSFGKKLLVIMLGFYVGSSIFLRYFEIEISTEENQNSSGDLESQGFFSRLFGKISSLWGGDKPAEGGQKDPSQQQQQGGNEKKAAPPAGSSSSSKSSGFMSKMFDRSSEIQETKNIPTRFKDVLGIDEFKEELTELVDFLKNPKKYQDAGAKLPKGILLVGPPGTGKTLLARALAGEAGCSFYYKSGSEFDEMFVGVGASRVRELFKKARQTAPSIIFIDEIDSVCGKRSATDQSHSRDTVNQMLAEMDGFKDHENVIVIGATNFEKSLDSAVKRPGRFDKTIHVPYPDIRGREQLFEYYLEKIQKHTDVSSKELAKQTTGFTGADIQNMVNVAVLNAIKNNNGNNVNQNGKIAATKLDFDFALDRIAMGIGRKNMFITDADKLKTAYHEGGHTITALLTKEALPLHKVTILPRGGALGFTSFVPETDQLNYTKRGMIASIDVAMGGRVAEELYYGNAEISTGCSNDLQKATEMAYSYVKELGMDENLTLISQQGGGGVKTSDQYNYKLDKEVQKILKESYDRVKNLLKQNDKQLQDLASELIKNETLDAQQVKSIIFKGKQNK